MPHQDLQHLCLSPEVMLSTILLIIFITTGWLTWKLICLSEGLGGIERLSTAQTLTWVWRISRCLSPIEMSSGWPQWYRYRSCHGEWIM